MATAPAFPGYSVVGLLGQGGMGQVFLAEDQSLGRRVAIKTVRPEIAADGEGRARFLREARAMATVEHPRVVRVYSFGETGGHAFFVMELVDGETLAERLARERRLPESEALRIAREVAEALAAAWARGIIHRDVKPANVILDREGHVHVADFGLARPVRAAGTGTPITGDGAFVGSPHYLAPEQARGHPLDFRADIHALGIVLYEMLAGRRPFEGRTGLEVIARRLSEAVPPLSDLASEVPPAVVQLVQQMTESDPAARPASYAVLLRALADLGGASDSTPVATSTMPARLLPSPVRVGAGPSPPQWLTLGVPLLSLLVLLGGYLWREWFLRAERPPGATVVALAPLHARDAAGSEEAEALAGLVESELRRLAGDEEGHAIGLAVAGATARGPRDARRLGERASADVVLWGQIHIFRGDVEAQADLTPVVGGGSSLRLGSLPLTGLEGSPLEIRRAAAARIAESVLQWVARRALERGRPAEALSLLRECEATDETMDLRTAALDALGRSSEAGELRRSLLRTPSGRDSPR